MRRQTVNPAGVPKPKVVPDPGAAPNANGDRSLMVRPPRLKNTRDYGKKPVVMDASAPDFSSGNSRLGGI